MLKLSDVVEILEDPSKGRIINVHCGQGTIGVKIVDVKGVISEERFPDDSVEVLNMYLFYTYSMLVDAMHEYEISDDEEVLSRCVYKLLQAE